MTKPRRLVQELHERNVVRVLLKALNRRHGAHYVVAEEPNPPEAIIRTGRKTSWVEVVTAYWTPEYARDLNSRATPGEQHLPVGNGMHIDMDEALAENFTLAVQKKLGKSSYESFRDRYGPGYLAVSIQSPFFDSSSLPSMRAAWSRREFDDRGCFRSIFLVFPSNRDYAVARWQK